MKPKPNWLALAALLLVVLIAVLASHASAPARAPAAKSSEAIAAEMEQQCADARAARMTEVAICRTIRLFREARGER